MTQGKSQKAKVKSAQAGLGGGTVVVNLDEIELRPDGDLLPVGLSALVIATDRSPAEVLRQATELGLSPRMTRALLTAAAVVEKGGTVAEAVVGLPLHPEERTAFGVAAEMGCDGVLLASYARLAGLTANLRRRLQRGLAYVGGTSGMGLAVFVAFLLMSRQQFKPIFEGFGVELPGLTTGVLSLADLVWAWGVVLVVGLVAGLVGWWLAMRSPVGLRVLRELIRPLPVVGEIVVDHARRRAIVVLADLVEQGVGGHEAAVFAGHLSGLTKVRKSMEVLARCLMEGEKPEVLEGDLALVALPFYSSRPPAEIARDLRQVAELYQVRSVEIAAGLGSVLEPVLVLVLGWSIGMTVLAMFMPLVKLLNDLA